MAGKLIFTYFAAKFNAIHTRHHPVADDQLNIVGSQHIQTLLPFPGHQHPVIFRQAFAEEMQHFAVVFDQQNGGNIRDMIFPGAFRHNVLRKNN